MLHVIDQRTRSSPKPDIDKVIDLYWTVVTVTKCSSFAAQKINPAIEFETTVIKLLEFSIRPITSICKQDQINLE